MSRGNYHLTIATTPEALTEDDVTPSPDGGKSKREITDKYHQGLFLISENEALWVFSVWLSAVEVVVNKIIVSVFSMAK